MQAVDAWRAIALAAVLGGTAACAQNLPADAPPEPAPAELAAQLSQAKALPIDDLGPSVQVAIPWATMVAPNPDGKTHDVIVWYFKKYQESTRAYITDLGTGEQSVRAFPELEKKGRPETGGGVLYYDGKIYWDVVDWSAYESGGRMFIYTYDPATNKIERAATLTGVGGETTGFQLGHDGLIYGTGTWLGEGPNDKHKVTMYSFDPKTGAVKYFGPLGPERPNHQAYAFWTAVDDTHAYIASGKIPWYLVAVELKTGKWEVIKTAPEGNYDNRMWIFQHDGGGRVKLQQGDTAKPEMFWLYHGQAIPVTDMNAPPFPKFDKPRDHAPKGPELFKGQLDPDDQKNAVLWYRYDADKKSGRTPEEMGWRKVTIPNVESYPLEVFKFVPLSNGNLFGATQGYGTRFQFDPKSGKVESLGRGGLSPYGFVSVGDKLWWSGYSEGPIFEYDPNQPWTLEKGGVPGATAPDRAARQSNPRFRGEMFDYNRGKKFTTAAAGADGKIYFGGFGQRDYSGGSLGWIDPDSGKIGGLWEPFSGHPIYEMEPALGGTKMVLSTRTTEDIKNNDVEPSEGKIFIWDVASSSVERSFTAVPGVKRQGELVETAPGIMVGLADHPSDNASSVLYSFDVRTGNVLWRKTLPAPAGFVWGQGTEQWDLIKGPDGKIYTWLGKALVRIEPQDGKVTVLGAAPKSARLAFSGNDLYLAGAESVRRVKDATKL